MTAKGEISERVEGLEVGADDYLPKPFEPKELVLRIKNILNKTKRRDLKRVIEFGSIKIDLNKHLIIKNSKEYSAIYKPEICDDLEATRIFDRSKMDFDIQI